MKGHFAFLPDARTVLARRADAPTGEGHRRHLDREVEITRDGARAHADATVALSTELLDAGDVVGFERRAIALTEPRRGARGFEPNYFPYVDLVDADLPWRYSLDTSTGHRIQPWIALIALTGDEFTYREQGAGPLPRIRVKDPKRCLPRIDTLWASAHVHVERGTDTDTDLGQLVNADPAAQLARILCLRTLEERERYELFLIPTFDAGRRAGLGQRSRPEVWDAPAWQDTSEPVDLPVYHHSHFVTSALEDVELLVRRLRARPAGSADLGGAGTASAARPGYYDDQDRPGRSFQIQAAMRPPGTTLPDPDLDADDELPQRLATTLTKVIAGDLVTEDGPDADDPLVAMPAYGWRFRHEEQVDATALDQGWFHRLNLDLALRQVAGLGARAVRDQQERFVAAAWDQYDEIVEANRRLSRLELAEQLAERLAERRLQRLPNDVRFALEEPLQAVAVFEGQPVAELLATRGVPRSFASVELRRVASRRPVRASVRGQRTRTFVPNPPIPGDQTPDLRFAPAREIRPVVASEEIQATLMGATQLHFSARIDTSSLQAHVAPQAVQAFRSAEIVEQMDSILRRLPRFKADVVVGGRRGAEAERIAPVMRAPRIADALVEYLEEQAPAAILSGVEGLPDDTVTVVEENRAFVESLLVGANHEFNHELRWRGFPTDMRGTVFRRFWNRGLPADDENGDDIPPIHTWQASIGRNVRDDDHGADLVLMIKGGIVRKLGKVLVVLNEATGDEWQAPDDAGEGGGTDHQPVFDGTIGDDVAYYGFAVPLATIEAALDRMFFVLYEPQHRLRFGLDIATATVRRERFSTAGSSLPFPLEAVADRRPRRTQQQPPRAFTDAGPGTPTTPQTWSDLSRSHVEVLGSGYLDLAAGLSVAEGPDHWGSDRTSASIARSIWQQPLAAVIPARRVL